MNQEATRVVSKAQTQAQPGDLLNLALLQLTGTVVFSLVLYFCFDLREAISALLGGSIAMLASLFSAWQLYRGGQNQKPGEMLVRFYISVVLKIAFSLAIMAICIIFMKVSMLPFIIAYLIAAVVINWLVLLLPEKQHSKL